MSMIRKIQREIARNRLADAGYDKVNKRLGMTGKGRASDVNTMLSQRRGFRNSRMARKFATRLWKDLPPVWKRVLVGDLAEQAEQASKKASMKREIAYEKRKMERKNGHHRAA